MEVRPWPAVVAALPPMTDEERERLRASIAEHGVRYPVLALPDGRIIDGAHRWEVTGGTAPVEVLDMDEDAAFALAVSLKIDRAHLTRDQIKAAFAAKAQAAAAMRKAGASVAAVAERLGVSGGWVSRRTNDIFTREGLADRPDRRRQVGREQESTVVERLSAGASQAEVAQALRIAPKTVSNIARRHGRRKKAKEAPIAEPAEVAPRPLVDFRERAEQQDGSPARMAPPRKEPDPAVVVRASRSWLKQAERTSYDLRNLWSQFDAALGDGVAGEVLSQHLDDMAEEFRSFAESIRQGAVERRSRGNGRTTG